ncbi:Arc family DNA-binding protein [Priestia megaterium]|nr:Arc family DNA-binding protein [Priestia megaterium]
MAISKDKVATNFRLNKELKEKLMEIAEEENRSFNNLMETVLKEYADQYKSTRSRD